MSYIRVINDKSQDQCTIRFLDNLVYDAVEELRTGFMDNKEVNTMILDFGKVETFDSSGIGILLEMRHIMTTENPIKIVNISDEIKDKFDNLKLSVLFDIQ